MPFACVLWQNPRLGKHLGPDAIAPVAQGPRPILRAASVVQSTVMNHGASGWARSKTSSLIAWQASRVRGPRLWGRTPCGGTSGSRCHGKPSSSQGLGTFLLAVDAKALEEAPGFERDHWPAQAQPLSGAGK